MDGGVLVVNARRGRSARREAGVLPVQTRMLLVIGGLVEGGGGGGPPEWERGWERGCEWE